MTPQEGYTMLGTGGMVYVTGPDGNFPCTDDFAASMDVPQIGLRNVTGITEFIKSKAAFIRNTVSGTYATSIITLTNAAADNCTSITVGGVAQLGGAVAMTAGNLTVSAASITAAMNAYVPGAPYDWAATPSGALIYLKAPVIGTAPNAQTVAIAFSGLSTATVYPTFGGTDADEYRFKIFIDPSPSASVTSMRGSAVEITQAIGALPPNPPTDVAVVANALTFTRKDTTNNVAATGGGTINNVFMADVQEGDTVTVYTKAGELPATVATGAGNITLSTGTSYVSSGPTESISLQYKLLTTGPNTYGWVEASSRIEATPANIRASGSIVPQTAGITNIAVTLGGAGANYVLGGANLYSVRMTGAGNLTGNYTLSLTAGTGILDGDMGIITGQGSAITYTGAFTMAISGITIPASLALTGSWSIAWQYQAAVGFMVSLMPDITRPNIVGTSQFIDLAVTNAKIASGIDGAKLLANSVSYGAVDPMIQAMLVGGGILYASVTIASADVLTLNTTPIQIVAAPGAGFALILQQWTINMIFNTTAYATNIGLVVRHPTVAAVHEQGRNLLTLGSAPAPGTIIWTACSIRGDMTNTQIVANQPLEVAVLVGDPTAGDSDIQVRVWYLIKRAFALIFVNPHPRYHNCTFVRY